MQPASAPPLNPLQHLQLSLSKYNIFQLFIPGLVTIPVRIAAVIVGMLLMSIIAECAVLIVGRTQLQEKGVTGVGWVLQTMLRGVLRVTLFFLGIYWISVEGEWAGRGPASIVVANHTTWLDFMVVSWVQMGYPVSRVENLHVPFFGGMTRLAQSVLVDRRNPTSRADTVAAIAHRGTDTVNWPLPVIIFPEGTCHNQTCLMQFQTGAFRNDLGVQPLAVEYTTNHHDLSWTFGSGVKTWLVMFSQWVIPVKVTWCAPVPPDAGDPIERAGLARERVAAELQCPVTDHNHQDSQLMLAAKQRGVAQRDLYRYAIESGSLRARFPSVTDKDVLSVLHAFLTIVGHEGDAHGATNGAPDALPSNPAAPFTFARYAQLIALPDAHVDGLCAALGVCRDEGLHFFPLAHRVTEALASRGPAVTSIHEREPWYTAALRAERPPEKPPTAKGRGGGNSKQVAPAAAPAPPPAPSISVLLRLLVEAV